MNTLGWLALLFMLGITSFILGFVWGAKKASDQFVALQKNQPIIKLGEQRARTAAEIHRAIQEAERLDSLRKAANPPPD